MTLSNDPWITVKDLPHRLLEHAGVEQSQAPGIQGLARAIHISPEGTFSFKDEKTKIVEAFDVNAVTTALRVNGGNISKAASWLGLGRNAIHKMIRKYNIDPRQHRS